MQLFVNALEAGMAGQEDASALEGVWGHHVTGYLLGVLVIVSRRNNS